MAPECLSLFHPLQGARVVHHGESTGLAPSDNIHIRCIWVDFVVGSLPCSERFFSRHSSFPLSWKATTSKFWIYAHLHKFLRKPKCSMYVKKIQFTVYNFTKLSLWWLIFIADIKSVNSGWKDRSSQLCCQLVPTQLCGVGCYTL